MVARRRAALRPFAPRSAGPAARARSTLGYAAARLGEHLARGNATDAEALWAEFVAAPEGYPLHAWLECGPLAHLPAAMQCTEVRRSVQQFAAHRERAAQACAA